MDFGEIIEALTGYIIATGEKVDEMPGLYAFGLGLLTWFMVEQIIRRISTAMRWVILVGAIVGLGLSLPHLVDALTGANDVIQG